MKSVFEEKSKKPTGADLEQALGKTWKHWKTLETFTLEAYPSAKTEWNYSGAKYGWSFRISDKKRVLVYLLPRAGFFKVAFVFGQKATDEILKSKIADSIKTELQNAKVYAEGRGIRVEVRDATLLPDLKKLIGIKLAH